MMSLRITDSFKASLLVQHMHRSLVNMLRYQQMGSSGRRVNSYSDDPRAVAAIQRYRSLLDINEQFQRNASRARSFVEATDFALQDVSELLAEVRALALEECSAAATPATNDMAAVAVDQLLQQILDSLNTSVEGNYIFSGQYTNVPPFVQSGDEVVYQGDSEYIEVQIGQHSQITANIPGDIFMGSSNAQLVGVVDMAPRLQNSDPLDLLNLGNGWEPGRFAVTDGNDVTHTIDLTGASTVGDVLLRIFTQSGGALSVAISSDGRSLTVSGTGPLTFSELDGGGTGRSLGLEGESDTDTFVGSDIRRAPNHRTNLADIPALNGALPLGEIVVQVGDTETTVDFSGAATIGDLNTILDAALPGLSVRVNGSVLTIVSSTAQSFQVRNAAGSTTASDLGLVGSGSPVRLFGLLNDLKAALQAHDTDAVRESLVELEAVENTVQAALIRVGGKETTLDWTAEVLRQRNERLQSNLSLEWDADLADVATELTRAETVYQATLLMTSRLFETNLMDYLR
jgi:flagellar hook-associated protein 3